MTLRIPGGMSQHYAYSGSNFNVLQAMFVY